MRRRTFEADGSEAIPEAVLHGDDLGEYRRTHPRPVVHQMRFYPCDWPDCDRGSEAGAFCHIHADETEAYRAEMDKDWWS